MGLKQKIKNFIKLTKEEKLIPVPTRVDINNMLDGKVALIVGGSGGLGTSIAKAYINSGAKVIITGTTETKVRDAIDKIGQSASLHGIQLDLNNVSSFRVTLENAVSIFGKIDILVNAAGLVNQNDMLEVTEQEYDNIMNVNAKGVFFLSQNVARYMIDKGIKGHILNISSASALRPAWTPYQMSKWAVRGLTLGMADRLLPYGIIVNALAPGPVATPMLGKEEGDSIYIADQPSGRYAVPEELANMAVVLVSDVASLVVGDTIYMTGGSGILSLHH